MSNHRILVCPLCVFCCLHHLAKAKKAARMKCSPCGPEHGAFISCPSGCPFQRLTPQSVLVFLSPFHFSWWHLPCCCCHLSRGLRILPVLCKGQFGIKLSPSLTCSCDYIVSAAWGSHWNSVCLSAALSFYYFGFIYHFRSTYDLGDFYEWTSFWFGLWHVDTCFHLSNNPVLLGGGGACL